MDEDVIRIRVEANTDDAATKLKEFKELVNSVKDGARSGLGDFVGDIEKIADSVSKLDGFGTAMMRVSDGISVLSDVDDSKIGAAADALAKMGDVLPSFAHIDADNMTSAANAIGSLPSALDKISEVDDSKIESTAGKLNAIATACQRAKKAGYGIAQLASGLKNLPEGLENFSVPDKFASNIENLGSTLTTATPSLRDFATEAGRGSVAVLNFGNGMQQIGEAGGVDEAGTKLDQLSGKIRDFVSDFNRGFDGIDTDKISAVAPAIRDLGNGLAKLDDVATSDLSTRLGEISKNTVDFIQGINANVSDEAAQKFRDIAQAVDQIAQSYKKLDAAQSAVAKSGSGNTVNKQFASMAIRETVSALKRIPGYAKSAFSALGKIASMPFQPFLNNIQNATGFLSKLQRMATSAVFYRGIKAMIANITGSFQTGIGNLYQWALTQGNSFVNTMDSLASSSQYLTNSLASAAAPLLDALAPALETIVNYAVSAINAISQLIAVLTGATTWRKAIRQQVSFAEAADSAGGSAGKAKKAVDAYKNTVMGFDELNKLNDVNEGSGSSGGGGASAPDYAGMFEEVPIDSWFDQFAGADWYELGRILTDKMADAMESVNWSKIQNSARTWATRFATLLNGAFDNKRFWVDLGTTIGEGVNTAVTFSNTFFDTTKFESLGDSLGEMLRQAMHTIGWEGLGQALTNGVRGLVDTLHGFVNNWTPEDWKFLGISIGNMIKSAILNIKPEQAIPDLVDLAIGIVTAISEAIEGADWQPVVDSIEEGLEGADWEGLKAAIKRLLDDLWNKTPISTVVKLSIGFSIAKTAFSLLGLGLKYGIIAKLAGLSTDSGILAAAGNIGSTILLAVTAAAGGFISVRSTIEQSLNEVNLGGFAQTMGGAVAAGAALGGIFGGPAGAALGAGIGGLVGELSELGAMGVNWARVVGPMNQANSNLAKSYTSLVQAMGASGKLSQQQVNTFTRALQTGSKKQVESIADLVDSVLDGSMSADEAMSSLDRMFVTVSTSGTGSMSALGKSVKSATASITKGTSSMGSSAKSVTKSFKDGLTSLRGTGSYGDAAISNLKRALTSGEPSVVRASESISSNAKAKLSTIKDGVSAYGSIAVQSIANGMNTKSSVYQTAASTLTTNAKNKLKLIQNDVSTYGSTAGQNITNGLSSKGTTFANTANSVMLGAKNMLAKIQNDVYTYGVNAGQNLGNGITNKAGHVNTSAANVAQKVSANLSTSNAYMWGGHVSENFAKGIDSKAYKVTNSVNSIASKVKNKLGFSEPEEGPLSNFHTFAPDMIDLFTQGIYQTMGKVTKATDVLASDISGSFVGINAGLESSGASLMESMAHGISGNRSLVTQAMGSMSAGSMSVNGQVMGDFEADVETALISALSVFAADDEPETPIILRIDSEDVARSAYKGRQRLARRGLTLQLA